MQTNLIPTNDYYRRILDTPDAEARMQLYRTLFVEPWEQMMEMFRGPANAATDDPLAGARAWNWLLPDQPERMAALLAQLEATDAWNVGRAALAQAAGRFDGYRDPISLDAITGWLVLGDPARSNDYEMGYTGATDWMQPRFIGQYWAPDAENLMRLPLLVAHEMHHLIRGRAFPWGPQTSVADYIVMEGTAESFATALFGADKVGRFVTGLQPEQVETARRLIGQGLHQTGFAAIRGYVFGDAIMGGTLGMPTYGGYAVGYRVVQAFLERSGKTIEEATFLPAQAIVQGSGYFAEITPAGV